MILFLLLFVYFHIIFLLFLFFIYLIYKGASLIDSRVIIIEGDIGSGKSRLIYEFQVCYFFIIFQNHIKK